MTRRLCPSLNALDESERQMWITVLRRQPLTSERLDSLFFAVADQIDASITEDRVALARMEEQLRSGEEAS